MDPTTTVASINAFDFLKPAARKRMVRRCQVCHAPARHRCPKCRNAYFCSPRCFASRWPEHRVFCSKNTLSIAAPFQRVLQAVTLHVQMMPTSVMATPGGCWLLVKKQPGGDEVDGRLIFEGVTLAELRRRGKDAFVECDDGWWNAQQCLLDRGDILIASFVAEMPGLGVASIDK
jgi:hypothetical protein